MTNFIYSTIDVGGRQVAVRRIAPAAPAAPPAPPVDYSEMTKSALIALAEDRSVEVMSRMTKAKIIEALEGAD